mgnify:FL=1
MSECTCHDVLIVKNLNRWFKEKWVDVSRRGKDGKHPPCGRSKAKKGRKGYPKCRPSVRVSSKTPKTSGEMTSGQKRAATKRKRAKKQGVGGKPTVVKSVLIKAPRIPRKKGQPAGSKKHSDLYTDENPKGTIHGLGFKDPAKAKQSVSKIKNSSRSHAHKTQAAIAMEQRAREMGKTKEAGVYRNFIEQQKKKTKQMKKSVLVLKQGEFPENMPDAAPELISVGSMLGVDAPETCTIPGCNNPPMMKARYANPLRSVDYTHHMCTEHAMQYEPDLAQVLVQKMNSIIKSVRRGDYARHLPTEMDYDLLQTHLRNNPNATIRDLLVPYLTGKFVKPDSQVMARPPSYQGGELPFPLSQQKAKDFVSRIPETMMMSGGRRTPQLENDFNVLNNSVRVLQGRIRQQPDMFEMQPPKTQRAFTTINQYGSGFGDVRGNPDLPTGKFGRMKQRMTDYLNTPVGLMEDSPMLEEQEEEMIQAGEPIDLSWRLLKNPVSPEAKRHKLEYDKKYESTPERVKYREELNRERRRRGIYGKGGPDMSHTKRHTLVAEDPHTNRARHFKERGTLKSTKPIDRELVLVTTGRL